MKKIIAILLVISSLVACNQTTTDSSNIEKQISSYEKQIIDLETKIQDLKSKLPENQIKKNDNRTLVGTKTMNYINF